MLPLCCGCTSDKSQQFGNSARAPGLGSAYMSSLYAYLMLFYFWCGPIRSSPTPLKYFFPCFGDFLSKRLYLCFYLKSLILFVFFYLKMIKGLFQISSTFLFPITFDQRLTDSITIGSLQIDTNVRSCCCELYDRRLLWANFCLKSE